MQSGQPSRTALAAAAHRAVHQILDQARYFHDPLALKILGTDAEALVRDAEEHPSRRRMRIFIAVRTRFAEDALAEAVNHGVRQLVVLGAGLDTFAYRSPFGDRLRVFEVDHPATQAWKQDRLAEASIPIPPWLTFAPIDFEQQTLADGLASASFDPTQPTFFTWLGVVPYLTEPAIFATLGFIIGLPGGAHVVFDYSDPPELFTPEQRARHEVRAGRVADLGEAWVSFFDPATLHFRLAGIGFAEIEDFSPREIAARYFPADLSRGGIPETGGHILRASTRLSSGS